MAILALTTDVYRFDDLTTCYPAATWHYAQDVTAAVKASQTLAELKLVIAVIGDGGIWQPDELRPLWDQPLLIAIPQGYSPRDLIGASAASTSAARTRINALTLSRPLPASERLSWQRAIASHFEHPSPTSSPSLEPVKDKKKRPTKDGGVQKVARS